MFTGIVEELGTVHAVLDQGDAVRLTVRAEVVLGDVRLGDSIAVNGCCLTVVNWPPRCREDRWTCGLPTSCSRPCAVAAWTA